MFHAITGMETSARIYHALNIDKNLLRRCQRNLPFRVARDFRVLFQNGTQRSKLNRFNIGLRPIKCCNNSVRVWIYPNRIKSTKLNYDTELFMCRKHVKQISTEFNWLVKKFPLLTWMCSFFIPLQSVMWYHFPTLKDCIYNRILKCGKCEALVPVLSSPDNIVSQHNNIHYSQFVASLYSLKEFFLINLRAMYLLCVFSPLLLAYPLTYVNPRCFTLWLRLLYIGVENSGATFVKLGQWASTRRDLFSKEFCDLFSGLHHKVRPHAWSHTATALKQAYGKNWQQMLHLSYQQEPIGSGCIAQVYKGYVSSEFVPPAILKTMKEKTDKEYSEKNTEINTVVNDDAGASENMSDKNVIPVAIKVLHPKIRETFHRDLKLMKAASKFLTVLFPKLHWVNLNQCVEEFAVTMRKQLDMHYEFQCLMKFTQDFQSFPNIKVPQPIPFFLRHNILVETFEEGISMNQILMSTDHSLQLKKELAGLGLDVLLQMVFVNNFVHADLHPGNLLVQNTEHYKPKKTVVIDDALDTMTMGVSPIEESSLKLVLLDCGITASLSPDDRLKFQEVFTAVVRGKGETVADLFLSKSPVNQCTDPELFRKEMAQLVTNSCQNLRSVSKIRVAELMNDLFTVLSRHKIQLDASFATIILAIAMLEGLGRTLDPDLNLLDRAKPVLLGSYLRKL